MHDKKDNKQISEQEVKQLFEKVREFQEANQKYLIKPASPKASDDPQIINMANTIG